MKAKPLPPTEELRKRFRYEDGKLYHRINGTGLAKSGSEAGGMSSNGYKKLNVNCRTFLVHRIIWKMHHGSDPVGILDHIDGDKLNNRVENLQDTDKGHNMRRSRAVPGNVFQRTSGRFQASVRHEMNLVHVGTHDTEAEARAAIIGYCDENGIRYD